jgi:putative hydrolase of the HAD superfamily
MMKRSTDITTLFLDIGGVLLTDGWGHQYRTLAARTFDLNPQQLENWQHLAFETHQEGKLTLQKYLGRVVFYNPLKNVVRNKVHWYSTEKAR